MPQDHERYALTIIGMVEDELQVKLSQDLKDEIIHECRRLEALGDSKGKPSWCYCDGGGDR